jgi:hypothetical protein
MHCHIAWHQSSGLALQLLERQSEIKATIKDEEQINDTCAAWVDYTQKVVIEQDDSGFLKKKKKKKKRFRPAVAMDGLVFSFWHVSGYFGVLGFHGHGKRCIGVGF